MARKILLADDSVTAQNMGRKILADAGYEVITVNNGSAALKKITEQKPDLIVLDVYMPGYSGLEVCQRLKEAHDTARIPVLLTVGKLEPFKPEEAKRVRAEGFIVKPFEASELLSALTKLEDKIVPRAEASKSGRFARAIAAVEDTGRDRYEPAEEDTGWKNRISFPSKKKTKDKDEEEQERAEERALYNQVNRDLRTVPQDAPARETDSLKDALPKDVTLEEIAAIAAAAAQVQAAENVPDIPQPPVAQQIHNSEIQKAEEKIEAQPVVAAAAKASEQIESSSQKEAAQEEAPATATFAVRHAEKDEEKVEPQPVAATNDESKLTSPAIVPGSLEAPAAVAGAAVSDPPSTSSTHEAAPAEVSSALAMAAAVASASSNPARWMAVPVTADAAENAISLDQEMQNAHAAVAASEAKPVDAISAPAATEAPAASTETMPVAEISQPAPVATEPVIENQPATEPVARATAHEESVLGQALSTVANTVVNPPAAESVPAIQAQSQSVADSAPAQLSSPAPAETAVVAESPAPPVPEASPIAEERISEVAMAQENPAQVSDNSSSHSVPEVSRASAPESQPVAESVSAAIEAQVRHELAAGGTTGMADNRDSDLAASTAAAWASWRQIRSDEPKSAQSSKSRKEDEDDDEPAPPVAKAAMAVAAGAEKRPEEAHTPSDPSAIASIVDSVLAELRPKIVEEISRKLGEK